MNTQTLIKECQIDTTTESHKQRVEQFTKGNVDFISQSIFNKLKESNFRVFVEKEAVMKKFNHHAGINGSYESGIEKGDWAMFLYVFGSFAAIITGIIQGLTGSNWYFMLCAYPIVFAWLPNFYHTKEIINYVGDIPDFALDNVEKIKNISNLRNFTIHSMQPMPVEFVKIDPVMICWITEKIGVVVAIWDGEKEIEAF